MSGSVEKIDRNREIVEFCEEHTFREAADKYGISIQAISLITKRYNKKYGEITDDSRGPSAIVYPRIRKYMIDNQINISKLCEEINKPRYAVCQFLYGKTDKVSLAIVDSILNLVGMKYEEAFSKC